MFTRAVAVIGTGYVGLTTGACLASLGHTVVCADNNEAKIEALRHGGVAILEPDLPELVTEGMAAGRLRFVTDAREAAAGAEVVFLCVPTPMGVGGVADLSIVESVLAEIRDVLLPGAVVVNKSTVPVGTAARTADILGRDDVAVVSNPEFLREGSAVRDFLHPDRVVVGAEQQDAAEKVAALYARLGAPTVLTDAASAELVKYAANCFLAMKLSYVNAIAELCERLGADIKDVTEGMGYDKRIGTAFLSPGPGWGGSCLPKDVHALLHVADGADFEFRLLRATIETNTRQFHRILDKTCRAVTGSRTGSLRGHRIGLSRDRHRSDVGHRRRGAFVHHRRGFVRSRSRGRFGGLLGRLLGRRCLLRALAAGGEHERRRGEGGAAQEPGKWGGRGEVRSHSFTLKSKLCPPRSIRERPLGFPCSAFAAGCCGARKAS